MDGGEHIEVSVLGGLGENLSRHRDVLRGSEVGEGAGRWKLRDRLRLPVRGRRSRRLRRGGSGRRTRSGVSAGFSAA